MFMPNTPPLQFFLNASKYQQCIDLSVCIAFEFLRAFYLKITASKFKDNSSLIDEVQEKQEKMAFQQKTIGDVLLIREFCVKIVGESGECFSVRAICGRMFGEDIFSLHYRHLQACSD